MTTTDGPTVLPHRDSSLSEGKPDAVFTDRVSSLGGIDLISARFVTHATQPHAHRDIEVGVVVSGTRRVQCRAKTHLVGGGSILLFGPGDEHCGAPVVGVGSEYRSFLIPTDTLLGVVGSSAARSMDRPRFVHPVVHDEQLARQLVVAHRALSEGAAGGAADAALIDALRVLWNRYRMPGGRSRGRGVRGRVTSLARAYIEKHFAEVVRLASLVELTGVNVFHLIRTFRTETGLPPYAYLQQVRVERAAQLLRQGERLSNVALRTGFADQSHLTRVFKRHVGVPPGAYQQRALKRRQDSIHYGSQRTHELRP